MAGKYTDQRRVLYCRIHSIVPGRTPERKSHPFSKRFSTEVTHNRSCALITSTRRCNLLLTNTKRCRNLLSFQSRSHNWVIPYVSFGEALFSPRGGGCCKKRPYGPWPCGLWPYVFFQLYKYISLVLH